MFLSITVPPHHACCFLCMPLSYRRRNWELQVRIKMKATGLILQMYWNVAVSIGCPGCSISEIFLFVYFEGKTKKSVTSLNGRLTTWKEVHSKELVPFFKQRVIRRVQTKNADFIDWSQYVLPKIPSHSDGSQRGSNYMTQERRHEFYWNSVNRRSSCFHNF